MSLSVQATNLTVAPLLPWPIFAAIAALGAILCLWTAWRGGRGAWLRALALAAVLAALLNPALLQERRALQPDEALLLIDDSPSMAATGRLAAADAAAQKIQEQLARHSDLILRTARWSAVAGAGAGALTDDGTTLLRAYDQATAETPRRRFAGAILITDGQAHDALPAAAATAAGVRAAGPIHSLIVGRRDETDRRLTLARRPSFALVDQDAQVQLRVDDPGATAPIKLTWRVDGGPSRTLSVRPNQETTLTVPIRRAGETLLEAEIEPGPNELTLLNNSLVVPINGVRDRLRVLLISGEPHPGERTWRALLKSDPAVDLVHFTILRPPEKQDNVPTNELSLIAFPVQELFDVKLRDFDLVIFDRYRTRSLVSATYLQMVARYVRQGGAVLESAGPSFASSHSLFLSPMGEILPGAPTGRTMAELFTPQIAPLGARHPVTAGMGPPWGRWLRQVELTPRSGSVVMTGAEGAPLLILDRVGQGRAAQFASDQIWLWRRGFDGGGPDLELLRRIIHWLMREPALEEEALIATPRGMRIDLERRSLTPGDADAHVTDPSGRVHLMRLIDDGRSARASFVAAQTGLHRIESGPHMRMAAVGTASPKEFADVRATAAPLTPLAQASGGGVFWLQDGVPALRRVDPDRPTRGVDWLGLVRRGDYDVVGLERTPLAPPALGLTLALALLLWAWLREARKA